MANSRAQLLESVLGKSTEVEDAIHHVLYSGERESPTLHEGLLQRARLANQLADMSNDNEPLVANFISDPNVTSLRHVALNHAMNLEASKRKPFMAGSRAHRDEPTDLDAFQAHLFQAEPSAVLHRMVLDKQIQFADDVHSGVVSFFEDQPDFNIRETSVNHAISQSNTIKNGDSPAATKVVDQLKTLQRVQALTRKPEPVPTLVNSGITTALQVSSMPQKKFLAAFQDSLGETTALEVHDHAMKVTLRNEQALTQLHQAIKGTGIAAIDGGARLEDRIKSFEKIAKEYAVNINLEELFGDVDFCACSDCTSLTSPAAYYVDLLQYLRSNNLDPTIGTTGQPRFPNTGKSGYAGTALEKLLRRRPDLQHLELTCENTNTLIPYVDLVNEVMESFVVHELSYTKQWSLEKQVEIDVFNVREETSNELLAEAQHTNYNAYCTLRQAVFPLGKLPYHQPIDAIRIYLRFLKTSRHEVLDTFRKPFSSGATSGQELRDLHTETMDRAFTAEFLGIIQEEYIILTKEAFWPKSYFEITSNTKLTKEAYQKQIGVRSVREYWGYKTEGEMVSDDKSLAIGLSFVKKQFLKRSGMTYLEVVDLVKTQFVNPRYPRGRALALLQSIRFSYRFLQLFVNKDADNKEDKFKLLVEFLVLAQPWINLYDIYKNVDKTICDCKPSFTKKEICQWVYRWFERMGEIVVLESGEGPTLPIRGDINHVITRETPAPDPPDREPDPRLLPEFGAANSELTPNSEVVPLQSAVSVVTSKIGTLQDDGQIFDNNGQLMAIVGVDSRVYTLDGKLLVSRFTEGVLQLPAPVSNVRSSGAIAIINREGYLQWNRLEETVQIVRWNVIADSCNINKVRLLHLDGTNLFEEEWDRMHRFIRLWRRLGWTIDETDKALWGLSIPPPITIESTDGSTGDAIDFGDFAPEECRGSDGKCQKGGCKGGKGKTCTCGSDSEVEEPLIIPEITTQFLQELVAVKKLLDLTGLELLKLLALWAPISTTGEKSLYSRLFLTHNLLGVDSVFKGDDDGNYLLDNTRISDHYPVILAALRLKRDELDLILKETDLTQANLTVDNISRIYRYTLISQSLRLKIPLLIHTINLFGNPFQSAKATLTFVNAFNSMTEQGFSVQQLAYTVLNQDDPTKPLGPTKVEVLKTTKTLFDGLNAIDAAHPDLTPETEAAMTADTVSQKTSLLFDQSVVAQITGLLDGTTAYTTNAPIDLTVTIPNFLQAKLSYTDPKEAAIRRAKLTVTGILTDEEIAAAKALASNPNWAAAIDRTKKQALSFFKKILSDVFSNSEEAIGTLLAGDVIVAEDKVDPAQPNPNTAPAKRLYFLRHFLPYLRSQLADLLVSSTMAGEAGVSSSEIMTLLLKKIIKGAGNKTALEVLKGLKAAPPSSSAWTGYLIAPSTDTYTFVGYGDSRPAPLMLDGEAVAFPDQQDDPTDVWFTEPRTLTGGRLYYISVSGQPVPGLGWMTPRTAVVEIPSAALIPDYSTDTATEIYMKLTKAAIVINGFGLSVDDVDYLHSHAADFAGFDLNELTLEAWKRVLALIKLRTLLPAAEFGLIDLFKWIVNATIPPTPEKIANQIVKATGWRRDPVLALLGPKALALTDPSRFRNEIALVQMQKALAIIDQTGVDVSSLFKWANPMAKFWPSREIAEEMRKSIRSRYSLDDFEQAVKPLHDELRMHERDALVAYLVVQNDLIQWGVVDADSLFEFFLIDVQMGACLKTSRIKQAISTVQLFVQRCILGLEEKYGVENDALDQTRWLALSKETIRTANVKVLLTPENYTVSSLRDDKSPLYEAMENEILQKDVNPQALKESMTSYLYGLDQVANLSVEGLYQDSDEKQTVYIIGRTRSNPYHYSYRTYQKVPKLWTPWQSLPIDIPTYQMEATASRPTFDGCYILPVVWQNRFLIFFAELAKKTILRDLGSTELAGASADQIKPYETWEIKLGWSELRNGKWTQKKVTVDSIMENATSFVAPPVDGYRFISRIAGSVPLTYVSIDVYKHGSTAPIGRFEYKGSQAYAAPVENPATTFTWGTNTSFHLTNRDSNTDDMVMYTFQRTAFELNGAGESILTTFPYASYPPSSKSSSSITIQGVTIPFNHTFSPQLLSTINTSPDLFPVFEVFRGITDSTTQVEAFGYAGHEPAIDGRLFPTYNELVKPYSLYNWEFGFHAPMQLADALLQHQHFDAALAMCHFVFDPYADGKTKERVWKWKPFSLVSSENVLEALFNSLQPNQPDKSNGQITAWRDNPFMPHVVSRARPVAYMKWTVMKYLQILIAYGDYYFRQNSLEAVPLAIQCYILASHIYGPAGQKIPKRGKTKPQTYYSLLDKWDAISNATVDLELAFPFSNQIPHPYQFNGKEIVLANIFGFATARYFCIPDNPQSRALREQIDDRLYKIRHCLDINGNPISLALWDPPLDPAMLVNAVAQGLSLSNVLNDLNAPMPNYRFYYLLQKALELCSELRSMGDKFLGLKEKRDSLALDLLRSTHEQNMNGLVMEIRKLQLDEANRTIESLRLSRDGPQYRHKLYASMSGTDAPDLVEDNTKFTPIALNIVKPTAEGDIVITATEKNEIDEAKLARDRNLDIAGIEMFNAFMETLPGVSISLEPWGMGGSLSIGPQNVAAHLATFARYLRILSDEHTFNSTNSGRKATYIKQQQERVQLANSAGYELKNIDAQIMAQKTRISIAAQEIDNQQQQMDHSAEVVEFLKSKYTNDALYSWMENSMRTLFYQTYTLAYDIAKKAEAAFNFERPTPRAAFIRFGYWDTGHDGLHAGEQLYLSLKQMETAYQDNRAHDYEITKSISLRQLDPLALLALRESGSCQLTLPEVLFDMDFPGHYLRRIKTVAVTIPCISGPYTSINLSLRLLSHRYRTTPSATDAKSYVETTDTPDPRFASGALPITSTALSTCQNDSGVFDLSFKDERYTPFEGAGCISSWQLDLPEFRQWDYTTITDTILTFRYVATDGGARLRKAATEATKAALTPTPESIDAGFVALLDLRAEWATEWARAMAPPISTSPPPTTAPTTRSILLRDLASKLPFFTRSAPASKLVARDISLLSPSSALPPAAFSVEAVDGDGEKVGFAGAEGKEVGKLRMGTVKGVDLPLGGSGGWRVEVELGNGAAWKGLERERVFLLIRYTIG